MNLTETWNAEYIEAQYRLWKKDTDSVSRDWQNAPKAPSPNSTKRTSSGCLCHFKKSMQVCSRWLSGQVVQLERVCLKVVKLLEPVLLNHVFPPVAIECPLHQALVQTIMFGHQPVSPRR